MGWGSLSLSGVMTDIHGLSLSLSLSLSTIPKKLQIFFTAPHFTHSMHILYTHQQHHIHTHHIFSSSLSSDSNSAAALTHFFADQTVISLRPSRGAGTRGSRFALGLSFTSSTSSDSLSLRSHGGFKTRDLRFGGGEHVQYTRGQLLQLRGLEWSLSWVFSVHKVVLNNL